MAQGKRPPPPHAINKYELRFSNSEHITRYDFIAGRKIIEPKYMDVDFLKIVGLWDSISKLIEVVRWTEFLSLTLLVYEPLCWEFLSSLVLDWNAHFQDRPVYIKFEFFNRDFETNLSEFNRRLRLPHGVIWTVRHENFNVQAFSCEITCEKCIEVCDNHGSRVAYSASGSKVTSTNYHGSG